MVSRAVGLLGMQEVHDLVLAASVAQSFEGMSNKIIDMQKFWERSVRCAITSSKLATLCNVLDGEHLFVAGLLRDIRHLYMYQLALQKAEQVIELAQVQGVPVYKTECALLGTDYAKVGADLMRQWQLPQTLWESTEFHVDPMKLQEYGLFASLVHIAAHLIESIDQNFSIEVALAGVWADAWQATWAVT